MKLNQTTQLVCPNGLRLVPYMEYHVPRYHRWMTDSELLQLTRSDPLSIEEEYENQQSWARDEGKLTFILLFCPDDTDDVQPGPATVEHMIGDVNVFMMDEAGEAEIDVMIAEPAHRGRGLGVQATAVMLHYAAEQLGIKQFYAKISRQNAASLSLFTQKLPGFAWQSESDVFDEVTYAMAVEPQTLTQLSETSAGYELRPYCDHTDISPMAPSQRLIGLIGCGSLGQYLAEAIEDDESLHLAAVWNRSTEGVPGAGRVRPVATLNHLPAENLALDLIVEVAHPSITVEYIEPILQKADYLIGSPTALADAALLSKVRQLCIKYGRTVYVPAGALWGALDIQKMADLGTLQALTIVMKKHPQAFRLESPLKELNAAVDKETVLYEGPVGGLCPLAPNNVNTMATAALAAHSLGFQGTQARLVSDPNLAHQHVIEIQVEGDAGLKVSTVRENPSKLGAVTGSATYDSFLSSLKRAHSGHPGIVFC